MSAEHVIAMNAILATSEEVRTACAGLPTTRVLSYDLANGPHGDVVTWTMTFADTVSFSLDRATDPDVVFTGDWKQMIASSKANRQGERVDPGVAVLGNMEIVMEVGPVLTLAGTVATVPVDFPEC